MSIFRDYIHGSIFDSPDEDWEEEDRKAQSAEYEHRSRRWDEPEKNSRDLFFIQCDGGGDPVKIGKSDNVGGHIRAIGRACPWPLKCLDAFSRMGPIEKEIHDLLVHHRTSGGWYNPAAPVMKVLEVLRAKRRGSPGAALEAIRAAL